MLIFLSGSILARHRYKGSGRPGYPNLEQGPRHMNFSSRSIRLAPPILTRAVACILAVVSVTPVVVVNGKESKRSPCSHVLLDTIWLHSQEEDHDNVLVYRLENYAFPMSRGPRTGI